jgi:hypothetical protein
MNPANFIVLFFLLSGFHKEIPISKKSTEFSQVEIIKLIEILHGSGCTFYKNQENIYFICLYKVKKNESEKGENFRIAQIKASHQTLTFLQNDAKCMIERSFKGEMSQYYLIKNLTLITTKHSMVIENEAKNHAQSYSDKSESYYIFYTKI